MSRKLFSGDKCHHQNTYFICNKNKYSSKNNIAMTLTCTNVTLRQKPLRNDRISLYLDYYPAIRNPYTMKMSRREFLGIYIYAKPKNEQQRMFNQDMLNKAEAIRCIRVQSLINEEFGFLGKNKQKVDSLPTSEQRHGRSMRNGIVFTTTLRNLSVANAPLAMSP